MTRTPTAPRSWPGRYPVAQVQALTRAENKPAEAASSPALGPVAADERRDREICGPDHRDRRVPVRKLAKDEET